MKLFKNKINLLYVIILLLGVTSCEDNESGIDIIGLEAKFITDSNLNVVKYINVSNNATSYLWDFGDGTQSTSINEEKTYCNNGSYNITLTAYDGSGASDTFQSTVVIDLPCAVECDENIDPAKGDLNWTFLSTDGSANFDAFGDIGGGIVPNPTANGVNTSCNVFKYEKFNGCQTWSGVGVEIETALDFENAATNKIFKMKVLAETQLTNVTLRLERLPFPATEPSQERIASITQLGDWQELTFDFSAGTTGTYKSIIIYFERNAPCDGDVYYFDGLIQE